MRSLTFLLILLLLFLTSQTVLSWKRDEFRNCNQTPFCKRARSRKPGATSLVAYDVTISDGDLTAKLLPKSQEADHQVKPLILTLSIYQDGIMRLKIDEDPSLNPPKSRFQVPDVIVPQFLDKKLWLQRLSTQTFDGDAAPSSIAYLSDQYYAVLRHDPFEVYIRDKSTNRRLISLNSHQLFDFEQLKLKKEKKSESEGEGEGEGEGDGHDWEERFRGHTDTRPHGPQSISFDVSFYDADFVSGIPEHATSLALRPTKGPGVDESEPYRLFNLDVFEYLNESPFGLYGSIPFMISHGKEGKSAGFFWLNAAEMQIDVLGDGWDAESGISLPSSSGRRRIDTFWMSEAGIVDAFFFVGPAPKDVVKGKVFLVDV